MSNTGMPVGKDMAKLKGYKRDQQSNRYKKKQKSVFGKNGSIKKRRQKRMEW